jgi:subtilisin family serine protease
MEIIMIGIGATVVFDLWLALLKRMGVKTMNMAFIGRWAGHLAQGRFAHASIAAAPAVAGEAALGWAVHYATGVAFAAALVAVAGNGWLRQPTLVPALAVGIATVGAPLFVMQPSMGLGIAASKTPTPWKNCLRSLANHTVFGFGLYLSALLIKGIAP